MRTRGPAVAVPASERGPDSDGVSCISWPKMFPASTVILCDINSYWLGYSAQYSFACGILASEGEITVYGPVL